MSETPRDHAGRFTSSTSTPTRRAPSFDLLESLRSLFRTAERAGDFSGAASIARVIRDLDGEGADAAAQAKRERGDLIIASATRAERNAMRDLINQMRVIKAQVAKRIGLDPETDDPLRHEQPPEDVVYPEPEPTPTPPEPEPEPEPEKPEPAKPLRDKRLSRIIDATGEPR